MEICSKDKCTGCYACFNACRHLAIEMVEDELGHIHPFIDEKKCLGCKLCELSCPVNSKPNLIYPLKCYAVALLDENELYRSASGGAAAALMRIVIENGGVAYGCSGEDVFNVHHIRIADVADIEKLRGSKYVQSNIGTIYNDVRSDLKDDRKVLFTGTPCQIAGLKSFLHKEYPNLITADLVCHGVPSQKMLTDNIRRYTTEKDGSKLKISFRRKYHKSDAKIDSAKIEYGWFLQNQPNLNVSRKFYDDSYMLGFLQCLTFRQSCYTCQYATSARCSDITLADFWGIGNDANFEKGAGVSLCLINSDKGQKLIEKIKSVAKIVERDVVEAIIGNGQLQRPSPKNRAYSKFRQIYPMVGLEKSIEESLYTMDKLRARLIEPLKQKIKILIRGK